MANLAFTCSSKIREQTIEARERKAHSLRHIARFLRLWRHARIAMQNGVRARSSARAWSTSTTTCSPTLGSRGSGNY